MKKTLTTANEKPSAMEAESGMIELNRLDEADVRHDRCPVCKNKNLDRLDGFKVCPRCDTNFKILDGKAFIIDNNQGEMIMSNRIITRLKKIAGNETISSEIKNKIKEIAKQKIEYAAGSYASDDTGRIYDCISNDMTPDLIDWLGDDAVDVCSSIEEDFSDNAGNISPELTSFIKEAVDEAIDNLDSKYVDNFNDTISEIENQIKEDKEINKDPWRGTGMNQNDFI